MKQKERGMECLNQIGTATPSDSKRVFAIYHEDEIGILSRLGWTVIVNGR